MPKRTVVLLAGVFLAAFGGWASLLWRVAGAPGPQIVSAFAALGAMLFAMALLEHASKSAQARAVGREGRRRPPRDGSLEAASGPFVPRGALLEAPLTGRPCVAWAFRAGWWAEGRDEGGERESRWIPAASGEGLAAGAIRSARGDVPLLGWPSLADFPAQGLRNPEARERLAALRTRRASAGPAGGGGEPDGAGPVERTRLEADERFSNPALEAEERIVPPDGEVTAIGTWSAARGGLVEATWASERNIRLVPGRGAAISYYIGGTSTRELRTGILVGLVMSAPAVGMMAYGLVRS